VPLIASWAGVIPPGRVCGDLVDFSDFLPTLCEAAGVAVPAALDIDGRSFLAQLKGQRGDPRDWTYSWFSKDGKTNPREWARNQRYKLYGSGEFYDLLRDVQEKTPLPTDRLGPEERDAHTLLRKALAKYHHARPAALSGTRPGKV
jgi:arylsulfatase A